MPNEAWCSGNANLARNLITVLEKCRTMSQLTQIHSLAITSGLSRDPTCASRILFFTATSDSDASDYSYRVFSRLPSPSVFDWNTIIRGCSKSKNPNRAVSIFVRMLREGVPPDHLTYPFLAKASAHLSQLRLGLAVHACALKAGYYIDRFIQNSLIHAYGSCGDRICARKVFDEMPIKSRVSWNAVLDAYAKSGDLNSAREVFELMPERDVVSWSALVDGYVKSGDHKKALEVFERMRLEGPKANPVTMVSVLCACAHLGALEQGKMMHKYIIENRMPLTLIMHTSLVDMYAKCGAIDEAVAVFRRISSKKTDVLIWNTVIGGLATHGLINESLRLFKEMQVVGVIPDEITYLCLLTACAHGGLVKEAWYFFESLSKHGMTQKSEHYACMVDVLSRAGNLSEAYQFLCQIPMEPTGSMLGALLSGCLKHRRLDLAEIVGKKLIELEPTHDGRYVGLSNAYAVVKRWDDARTTREAMESKGVKKCPGFSVLEIYGALHRFIAHDKTHPKSEQIHGMLNFVVKQMKSDVYSETRECYWQFIENG